MPPAPGPQHVHGPFDGDFDPFEDDDDLAVMVTFGRCPDRSRTR
ncbi:MAG: hypothetical protein ACK5SI_03465 [Planctomycetia bacterium]|jgi:hypothetical protein